MTGTNDQAGISGDHVPGEADVVLRDGSTVRVRPVRGEDEEAFFEFLCGLSPDSLALRFFGAMSGEGLRRSAREMARGRGDDYFALVGTLGFQARVVGHAMYAGARADHAEVAFLVADRCQGQGLGSALLGQLAQIASQRGINLFEASVRPQNHQMLKVFQDSGFVVQVRPEPGEIRVTFPSEITSTAREHFEERLRRADGREFVRSW